QKSLDTFSSTERNPYLQQASLYSNLTSAKEEKTQASTVFFSCPAPKDANLIEKTTIVLLNLPESKEDGGMRDQSSLHLCPTKVQVHTYDKETIKAHSSKNSTKTSEESAKSSPSLPKPSTSSLSPLALFSHV
ncbi:hypothetical protein CP061683_1158B, partial [Chlamydia psittaci 06-1683]